ncbi:hypothetical protein GCM10022251_42490 [Phytohabitans flavus]
MIEGLATARVPLVAAGRPVDRQTPVTLTEAGIQVLAASGTTRCSTASTAGSVACTCWVRRRGGGTKARKRSCKEAVREGVATLYPEATYQRVAAGQLFSRTTMWRPGPHDRRRPVTIRRPNE